MPKTSKNIKVVDSCGVKLNDLSDLKIDCKVIEISMTLIGDKLSNEQRELIYKASTDWLRTIQDVAYDAGYQWLEIIKGMPVIQFKK